MGTFRIRYTLNADSLIWISNVDTFNVIHNPLFFSLFGYPFIGVLSLNGMQHFKFPGLWLAVRASAFASLLVEFYKLFRLQTKDLFNLEINKKSWLSIDLDIRNSKFFSSRIENHWKIACKVLLTKNETLDFRDDCTVYSVFSYTT